MNLQYKRHNAMKNTTGNNPNCVSRYIIVLGIILLHNIKTAKS